MRIEGPSAAAAATLLSEHGTQQLLSEAIEQSLSSLPVPSEAEPDTETRTFTPGPSEPPSPVLRLAKQLRSGSDVEQVGRIRNAYEQGRNDALVGPRNLTPTGFHSSLPTRDSSHFIVLRAGRTNDTQPFFTSSRRLFNEFVSPGDVFDTASRSRTFRSQAELSAYLSGLGALPPLQPR